MADKRIENLLRDFEESKSRRGTWDDHWQDLADYVMPRREFVTRKSPGDRRQDHLFDSTGVWANEQFAALLHSFLTSPSQKWFSLRTGLPELDANTEVRRWLSEVRDIMLDTLNSDDSNFHLNAHELYQDLGAFGTSSMFVGTEGDGIVFATRPLREMYLKEDAFGRVDIVMREFEMTARQALQFYGAETPVEIKKALVKEPNRLFKFLHAIGPRTDRDPEKADAANKPFASIHVWLDKKELIREGGFDEQPFLTPRLTKTANEVYGRSPGMTALPDVKMLQAMAATVIRAAQKVADPPITAPHDGYVRPLNLQPGGINYVRASSRGKIEPLITRADPKIGNELLDTFRQQVLRAFFVDAGFANRPQGRTPPTAQEIISRRQDRLQAMSPIVARLQREFLAPLVERLFAIMIRLEALPPPPDVLQGIPLELEFISPAAMAAREVEGQNLNQWLTQAAPIFQFKPETADLVDFDALVRRLHHATDSNPDTLRSQSEVEEIRAARAEQQAQAAQAEQTPQLAQAAEQGSQALLNLQEAGQINEGA